MERRRKTRRTPAPGDPLARVRLRTGVELSVLDASDGGIFVEGSVRLLPGARLDVHVIAAHGRVLVRSRVTRAFVSTVSADSIRYRGALAFDHFVDTAARGYPLPVVATANSFDVGTSYPEVPAVRPSGS